MKNKAYIFSWIAQLIAVVIMGQTLFFKFTGHPETIVIFEEKLNMPGGQYVIGTLELIACILLLIPNSIAYGALLGAGLMTGAIIGHFTKIGWEGSHLQLGIMAFITLASCISILLIRRKELPFINAALKEKCEQAND